MAHQVAVHGTDDNAVFTDFWPAVYGKAIVDQNGGSSYMVERFLTTKFYKKIEYIAETFGFELSTGVVEDFAYNEAEKKYTGKVAYSLIGEGKQLKEMLTSLYGQLFPSVVGAKEFGNVIELKVGPDLS